ncbi:hypothetical protein COO60DRAFT_1676678, partial [Scenedesmus sp. NREL 46B-D3]
VQGSVPEEYGSLSTLETLALPGLQLNGTIPTSVSGLQALQQLDLSYNPGLSGRLPVQLGQCSNLTHIWLQQCSLNGSVPASFGGLAKLKHMSLAWNQLTGGFPMMSNMPALQELHLSGNRLGGMRRHLQQHNVCIQMAMTFGLNTVLRRSVDNANDVPARAKHAEFNA